MRETKGYLIFILLITEFTVTKFHGVVQRNVWYLTDIKNINKYMFFTFMSRFLA